MLVRWTSADGKNVALNGDDSRHQCRINGTAKRDIPVRHDRPAAAEVISFLKEKEKVREREREKKEGSIAAAGPVTGAGGSTGAGATAQTSLPNQYLPPQQSLQPQPQPQPQQPPANPSPSHTPGPLATATTAATATATTTDRDAAIKAMHEANIAAWNAQAEATNRLADAMIEVARSVDALAKASSNSTSADYRLADEVARLTHLLRGIVAIATTPVAPAPATATPAANPGKEVTAA
jgi:hypothetical protein